jgi:hypothetical protein
VNEDNLDKAAQKFPRRRKYVDFRKLYDESKDIDAVVVATTEHTHAFAVLRRCGLGKHVYCEKPLAHCVWECRLLTEEAAKARVTTQMGTQMHATDNFRRVVELIQTGAVGAVREVHVWVSRAWGDGDRPTETPPVPPTVHWDLWIGPAPMRPFHPSLSQRPAAMVQVIGTSAAARCPILGSHWNDMAFWALKLKASADHRGVWPAAQSRDRARIVSCHLRTRPERRHAGRQAHVVSRRGQNPRSGGTNRFRNGTTASCFIGDKGMLLSDYGKHRLLPEEKFADFKRPAPFNSQVHRSLKEWIDACKTGKPTTCNFDYAGPLTEANQTRHRRLSYRQKARWDPVKMKAKNCRS